MSADKYEKLSSQIQKLAALPPEKQAEHFAASHQNIAMVAPNIAPHVSNIAANAFNFLHNKLPKPNVEYIGDEKWEPSKSQKKQWLDYHDIVDDPVSVLDHVKKGTLTSNHLEALQAVHPALLQDMQAKTMEHMNSKSMKGLAYPTKISLSKFLGAPTHGSLSPRAIAADQMNYASPMQAQAAPSKGNKKSSTSGLNKLNIAKRATTQTEALEETNE